WDGPVGAVRIGRNDQGIVINPSYKERESGLEVDILACGRQGMINMLEVGASEVSESELVEGFEGALQVIAQLEAFQNDVIAKIGKTKRVFEFATLSDASRALFDERIAPKIDGALF